MTGPKMPSLHEVPAFMLETDDMVYSEKHDWFFRCGLSGNVPREIIMTTNGEEVKTVEIGRPRDVALAYNAARREKAIRDQRVL